VVGSWRPPKTARIKSPLFELVWSRHDIDVVSLDPFVKSHSVEENANNAVDFVAGILAGIATENNCAVDAPHHISKGLADPGNANRGRGASAFKDAARLVYTLTPMSEDEAKRFNVGEDERRQLIRMDSGKVNIAPRAAAAKWFKLVSVPLNNGTADYPRGDEVQTIEPWEPPDLWGGLGAAVLNTILTEIDKGPSDGKFYTDHGKATGFGANSSAARSRRTAASTGDENRFG
jgi:hypothetical protein